MAVEYILELFSINISEFPGYLYFSTETAPETLSFCFVAWYIFFLSLSVVPEHKKPNPWITPVLSKLLPLMLIFTKSYFHDFLIHLRLRNTNPNFSPHKNLPELLCKPWGGITPNSSTQREFGLMVIFHKYSQPNHPFQCQNSWIHQSQNSFFCLNPQH